MLALKTTAADMPIAVRRRKLRGRGSDRSGRIRFTSAPPRPACRPTSVRRLTAAWQDEHERWQERDLSARRYVYLWADGVYFTPRLEHDRQCILVVIGADMQGRKELLAIEDGFRESAQSWRELLLRLRDQNG